MAIYEMTKDEFKSLDSKKFAKLKIEGETIVEKDLQKILKNQIEVLSDDILIIGEEYGNGEFEGVSRSIDLLGLDKDSSLVVIELKRDENNAYMDLQALRYAMMVSNFDIDKVIEIYQRFCDKENISGNAEEKILKHLEKENKDQVEIPGEVKIILTNEDFKDQELTATILWLTVNYNIDIRCIRLIPYNYDSKIFVDVQQIIPLLEAKEYQIQKQNKTMKEKANKASSKDYTQYKLDGQEYNKKRLVLAVVTKYLYENPNTTYEELEVIFPKKTQGSLGVFSVLGNIKDNSRYFTKEYEILTLQDNCQIAVCTQWGKGNIDIFLEVIRDLKYGITAVDN